MVEVLPAIIEDTFREVEEKLKLVSPLVDWVQVDVCDGVFVPRTTWTNVENLGTVPASLNVDLHVMVREPRTFVTRAAKAERVQRITFHVEASDEVRKIIEEIQGTGREVGIAVNPETSVESLGALLPSLDAVLIMGVNPGWGGQGFLPDTPMRIAALKRLTKGLPVKIGVDGGIHLASGSAQAAVDAGVDFLVVGSGIFGAPDLKEAVKQFQQLSLHTGARI